MKRKNATRSALFTSIISLLLCVSMLVGTTFAWFTDEVKSGTNIIAAGNLDVELYHGKDQNPVDQVKEDTLLFTDAGGNVIDQWEPGVVAYTNLKVANVGTLALKYLLSINSTEMNYVQYTDGSIYTLADALKVAVVKDGISGDRAAVVAAGTASGWEGLKSFTLSGELNSKEESDTYGIVIYWEPGENDNLFNMNNGKVTSDGEALTITLGVNLFATQEMYEDDSFGADYDKLAPWTGKADTEWYNETATEFTITSAEELAGLAQIVNSGKDTFNGKTVKLAANIDLNNAPWTPIGKSGRATEFNGTFIGTGYTISNLYVTGTKYVGLFGATYTGAHIEGVTIDGAYVSGNDYVGAVVGGGYLSANCIKDCTVKSAKIIATPYLKADGVTYDGGAKAGAIVGSAYNGNLTGNKAIDCKITAYRDLGGIAGMLYSDGVTGRTLTASGNTVEKVTLTYLDLGGAAYDGDKVNENMGNVVGRLGKTDGATAPVVENNTVTNVTRRTVIEWNDGGITYTKDVDTGVVTLEQVSADYEGDTVTVPDGVTNIGGYSFAYNDNVETIVLSSTVTTLNDRAFRDTSASTVVLNEGLTNISYQAFRNAYNVTTVEIPSTVTTISKEAFQNSGITTLTIPATVTTIEYGACRDMKNVETVIIESNADIPVYAFRACTNLKTVILTGENVTFGGGSKGMIFTNKENGDGSAITVYVANETVKERLLAADTAAKDYGGYTIVVGAASASDNESLNKALTDGAVVVLPEGEFTLPSMSDKEGVTIIGSEGTVIGGENASTGFASNFGKDTTIKNVTFSGSSNGVRWSYANGGDTTFENCTFAGDSTYGFHIDQSNGATFTFNNCTFIGFNAFAGDLEKVVFNNCTFLSNGNYGHTNIWSVAEFNNCTWGDNTSVGQGKNSGAKLYFNDVEESYHHEYIGSADSLFAFAESVNEGGDSWTNQAVILVADIDLENKAWTPIGQTGATEFKGTFDGQNYTIKNLNVDNSAATDEHTSSGLFGWAESNVTIKNVKIDGAKVVGNHNVAVIVGYTYSGKIINCHVTNAKITCNHANDDACGDKCGLIVGYSADESRITGCSGSNSTVTAGRDAGQLIGCGYNVSVSDCTATNVVVSANGECTGANVNNDIIGRVIS